jgi:DnaJ-class molecular chaperone
MLICINSLYIRNEYINNTCYVCITMSHYETLGLSSNASEVEIKRAYRTLSFKYHPDRNSAVEAEDQIRKINDAYEILGDTQKRKQYDTELRFGQNPFAHFATGDMPFMKMPTMHSSDEHMSELFSALFGGMTGDSPNIRIFHGGMPMGPMGGMPMGPMGGMPMGGMRSKILRKPDPLTYSITITLEQAYNGCNLPIGIERTIFTGDIQIVEEETLYINIYPGIDNNEYIIIPEKGNINAEQLKGDVKVCISIDTASIFKRQGLNLMYYKTITLKESLCGFSFNLKHLNGKEMMFNNNAKNTIVKPNFKKVIPNLGMKREQTTGDLVIIFDIVFPDFLESSQIDALKDIL